MYDIYILIYMRVCMCIYINMCVCVCVVNRIVMFYIGMYLCHKIM